MGSRRAYARITDGEGLDTIGPDEAAFLAARDSVYLASVGANGWPYVQHRGGAPGFLRVLDERTLAFADLRGNKQYISVGNLATSDRVALIAVDYPARARLKVLAHARVVSVEEDPALVARLGVPGERMPAERAIVLDVVALDWNCAKHITPRFTEAEIATAVAPLRAELATLTDENARLRAELARLRGGR